MIGSYNGYTSHWSLRDKYACHCHIDRIVVKGYTRHGLGLSVDFLLKEVQSP